MKRFFVQKPVATAMWVACSLTASTFAAAHQLRKTALSKSEQQPTEEYILEFPQARAPATTQEGRKLFLASCAHCHGADARGDEGPDLHDVQVSNRYIRTIILRGIPHEMPSFKKKLGLTDITALTAYIRSLE